MQPLALPQACFKDAKPLLHRRWGETMQTATGTRTAVLTPLCSANRDFAAPGNGITTSTWDIVCLTSALQWPPMRAAARRTSIEENNS